MLRRAAIIAVFCGGGLLAALHATGRLEVVTDLVWHPAPAVEETDSAALETAAVLTEPAPAGGSAAEESVPATIDNAAPATPADVSGGPALAGEAPDGAVSLPPASTAVSGKVASVSVPEAGVGEAAGGATAGEAALAPSGAAPPAVPAEGEALAALEPGGSPDTALAETPGEVAEDRTRVGADGSAGSSVGGGAPASPRFDVVRVAPDGMAVIAGQAAPRSRVELLIDGEATMSADVDDSGSFAIIADIGTTDAPRTLQLRLKGAAAGDDTALAGAAIQISSAEAAELAASTAADVAQPVAPTDDEPVGEAPEQTPAPDTALAGLSAPVVLLPRLDDDAGDAAAPTAVRAGAERVALIAPGATTVPRLVLDTLSYVEGQDGTAIGRAPGAARIRVFVNNAPATEIRASDQGAWTASIPAAMMRRARLLRFEQVSDGGEVVYRLETRFSYREAGATLALRERTITVARGDSLWRLAENIYGEGRRYSVIFGANDGLIRDPDLIYPEQEFVIPELVDDPASR